MQKLLQGWSLILVVTLAGGQITIAETPLAQGSREAEKINSISSKIAGDLVAQGITRVTGVEVNRTAEGV